MSNEGFAASINVLEAAGPQIASMEIKQGYSTTEGRPCSKLVIELLPKNGQPDFNLAANLVVNLAQDLGKAGFTISSTSIRHGEEPASSQIILRTDRNQVEALRDVLLEVQASQVQANKLDMN